MTATTHRATPSEPRPASDDVGRLILRIALGGVLFAHGLQKFVLTGVDQVGMFFGSLGLPLPEVAATIVATLELVGGLALVLGILVRPVALLAAVELTVAIFTAHMGVGFFADAGGWELPALIAVSLVALALLGPGRLSVLAPVSARMPAFLR